MPVIKRYSGCKIEGCSEKHRRNGFCQRHDGAYKRGSLDLSGNRIKPLIRYSKDFECIKCGKTGKITKGFCKAHYELLRQGRIDFDGVEVRPAKRIQKYSEWSQCKISGCKTKPRIRGYCATCWYKVQRGSIDAEGNRLVAEKHKNQGASCRAIACLKPAVCRQYCKTHYARWKARRRRNLVPVGNKNEEEETTIRSVPTP